MASIVSDFLNYFKITKFNDYIYAISEPNITYKANCFLIVQKDEGILIDALTGVVPNFVFKLEQLFNIKIRKLYLTHSHYDHFGGYDGRAIKFVYAHKNEMNNLSNYYMNNKQVREEIFDNGKSILPDLNKFSKYKVKRLNNIISLKDGDEIKFGDLNLKIILTKGHTNGSLCFYEPKSKTLFSGDTIYNGLIDLSDEEGSLEEFVNSLKIISNYEISTFLCGHYDPIVSSKEINIQKLIDIILHCDFKNKGIYKLGLLNVSLKL